MNGRICFGSSGFRIYRYSVIPSRILLYPSGGILSIIFILITLTENEHDQWYSNVLSEQRDYMISWSYPEHTINHDCHHTNQ